MRQRNNNKSNNYGKFLYRSEFILFHHIKLTKKFLKIHPNIIVTSADKGNTAVLLDRQDYLDKSKELLNDSDTYKLLPMDPAKFKTKITPGPLTKLITGIPPFTRVIDSTENIV